MFAGNKCLGINNTRKKVRVVWGPNKGLTKKVIVEKRPK